MIIGVDGRSLLDTPISGVGEYTQNLFGAMLRVNSVHEYRIFFNAFRVDFDKENEEEYKNVKIYSSRIPNKIVNTLFLTKTLHLERFIGNIDHFFLPNHIFFSLKRETPYTITVHDLSFALFPHYFSLKGRLWHKAVHPLRMYERATRIIAVSESTKRDLMALGDISPEKIFVIHSGINDEFLYFLPSGRDEYYDKSYNLPERYIFYLGTVEKRKNVVGVIKAFDLVKKDPRNDDVQLLIAGKPGFGFRRIKKVALASQYGKDIRFLGYVEPKAKPYLYYRAACFAYPSFYEGFGFPPLEAMAVGTPVITSNVSSLPEVVGDAAILVDPYNVAELASVMSQLLQNQRLADIIGQRGKELARRYNWKKCAQETIRILET